MSANDIVFFILAGLILISSFALIIMRNPIYSALALALSMIGMAGLFYQLDAQFVAGVQLIVYAGAVMVLFVMVLMLFDLKHDSGTFSPGMVSGFLKLSAAGCFCGISAVAIYLSTDFAVSATKGSGNAWNVGDITKDVATELFSKYLFGFEAIGLLLLVIAIGAVALSRSVGGTHARH